MYRCVVYKTVMIRVLKTTYRYVVLYPYKIHGRTGRVNSHVFCMGVVASGHPCGAFLQACFCAFAELYPPVVFGKETSYSCGPGYRRHPVTCRLLVSQKAFPQRDVLSCAQDEHRTGQEAPPGQRKSHLCILIFWLYVVH